MSDLQETCANLLAAFSDTPQLRSRLAAEGRKLQQAASAAASAAAHSENGREAAAAAQALQMAAARCNMASQLIGQAEEAGKRFVQRTVGGNYGPADSVGGDAAAWAGGAARHGSVSFSSDRVANCWDQGIATPAGRAYYAESDTDMRASASALKPFAGEYTVDMHGSSTAVSVGDASLDARELSELIRADPNWQGQPVRLFSCNTGQGARPIAAEVAQHLDVRVTAPDELAWSGYDGSSTVSSGEWKPVAGSYQFLPKSPPDGHWRTFDP